MQNILETPGENAMRPNHEITAEHIEMLEAQLLEAEVENKLLKEENRNLRLENRYLRNDPTVTFHVA
jgi:hypothetical protein